MNSQIFLSVIIRFIINCAHWMVFAHLPVLLKSYGLTDIQIGIVIGLYSLSSMALMLPMGVFSDYFSPKRIVLFGSVLFCIYFSALSHARSFAYLIPTVLVGGLGAASLLVVTESLYLKLFGGQKRGQRVAAYQLSTYLGYGLGPLAGGMILESGPPALFATAAGGAGLVFVLCFFLKDSEPIVFSFKEYGGDIMRPKPLFLIACIFVIGTHFGVEQTSFSLLMRETLGLSAQSIGYAFAAIGLWMAAIVPFIGRMHDRRQDVFLFFLGGLMVSGFFQVATAWADSFRSLVFIRLMHTMGDAVALLELGVLTAMFFPSQRLGGNSGLLYGVRTMATFLSAIIAGGFNRQWGYTASFLGNGLFVLLFVGISIVVIGGNRERMEAMGWKKKSG